MRDHGTRWKEALARLWADEETSLRAIARALRADSLTVKRYALDLGLPFPRRATRAAQVPHAPHRPGPVPPTPTALEADRDLWRRAIARAPAVGTKALRARSPALYARLYRRDRAWLARHSPQRRLAPRPTPARVDWPRRDAALATQVAGVLAGRRRARR